MSNKNRKITVLVAPQKFEKFSNFCEQQGYKKSTLINKLISDFLNTEEKKIREPKE